MKSDHIDFLKKRAKAFLECAKSDFSRGNYDLVLFHIEQFIQLYLKHLILKRIGVFPKTHSLIYLIKELLRTYRIDKLEKFYHENIALLYLLEEAYITSRYLPRQYDKEIAKRILKFAEYALEVFEWVERQL